jgi:hypothetical protein
LYAKTEPADAPALGLVNVPYHHLLAEAHLQHLVEMTDAVDEAAGQRLPARPEGAGEELPLR